MAEAKKGMWTKFVERTRVRFGLGHGRPDPYRSIGFKSVLQKSLHFKSSRFREALMELAMMCSENDL